MKRALVFFALLFATAAVVPQDAPQDPRFTTKVEIAPDGRKMLSITNRSQVAITAVTVQTERTNSNGSPSRSAVDFDSASGNPSSLASAILLQETRSVIVSGPPRATDTSVATFSLKAVLFEDGSSYGDEESVARILRARAFLWRNVNAVAATLENAKLKPVTKDELVQQLDEDQKAEKADHLKEVKMAGALGGQMIASSAWSNAKSINVPGDALVSAAEINQFADSYLNMRQRLINSKPQIPETENLVAANAAVSADFEIRLGPGTKSEDVSVFYEIHPAPGSDVSGTTGGLGLQSVQHAFRIPALIDGKPAHSLRALVFGKGCAVKVIDIPDLAASLKSAEYDCVQLPLMNFTGRVEPSEFMTGKKYRVRIEVFNLTIARADLDSDGVFHAEITDYSSDPVCIPGGQCFGAALTFYADVVGAGQGGAMLEPINSAAIQNIGLRPMADYGGAVVFHAVAF